MSRRGTREKSVRMPVAHGPSIKDIERAERRARKNPLNWLREMAIIIICALVISSLLRALLVEHRPERSQRAWPQSLLAGLQEWYEDFHPVPVHR